MISLLWLLAPALPGAGAAFATSAAWPVPAALGHITSSTRRLRLRDQILHEDAEDAVRAASASASGSAAAAVSIPHDWQRSSGDPVSRVSRTLGILKSQMGKAEVELAEVKDMCLREKLTEEQCRSSQGLMQAEGKLRRLRAAEKTVLMMRGNASEVRQEQRNANLKVQNTTAMEKREHVRVAARIIAIKELQQIGGELHNEDEKDKRLQVLWKNELSMAEHEKVNADATQQEINGYDLRFRTKLRGILDGIVVGDQRAVENWDAAEKTQKKAQLVEANAHVMEEKAAKMLSDAEYARKERAKKLRKEAAAANRIVQNDGTAQPLDHFGEALNNKLQAAKTHPAFAADTLYAPDIKGLVSDQVLQTANEHLDHKNPDNHMPPRSPEAIKNFEEREAAKEDEIGSPKEEITLEETGPDPLQRDQHQLQDQDQDGPGAEAETDMDDSQEATVLNDHDDEGRTI